MEISIHNPGTYVAPAKLGKYLKKMAQWIFFPNHFDPLTTKDPMENLRDNEAKFLKCIHPAKKRGIKSGTAFKVYRSE
jgi:hypothetical protein